jgi:hypothetical protein
MNYLVSVPWSKVKNNEVVRRIPDSLSPTQSGVSFYASR